ncbi:MAG TPA: hypothetical protein VGO47_14780 [Chlamydiales bacterium]|nr:hypothetical protein [Chlamydiales bacterium]
MRGNTGILLIAVGLIALYIVLSNKYSCFVQFAECLTGTDMQSSDGFMQSDSPYTPPAVSVPSQGGIDWNTANVFDLLKKVLGNQP